MGNFYKGQGCVRNVLSCSQIAILVYVILDGILVATGTLFDLMKLLLASLVMLSGSSGAGGLHGKLPKFEGPKTLAVQWNDWWDSSIDLLIVLYFPQEN